MAQKRTFSVSEEEFRQDFQELVARGEIVCLVCGTPRLIHPHRLKPGKWGGKYEAFNVVPLCPTHHFAAHFLIDWFMRGMEWQNEADGMLLDRLKADPDMWDFWKSVQWPVCMEKLTGKGGHGGRKEVIPDHWLIDQELVDRMVAEIMASRNEEQGPKQEGAK